MSSPSPDEPREPDDRTAVDGGSNDSSAAQRSAAQPSAAPPAQKTPWFLTRCWARVRRETVGASLGFRAIFERDFLVLTSQVRFLVLRTLTALGLVGLSLAILTMSDVEQHDRGRFVFFGLWTAVPIVVALLGPPLAAAAISGERALGTLPLVLAAPIRPTWFVVGKLASRFSTLMIFVGVSVPIAGVSLLYGGVSGAQLLRYIGLCTGLALWASAAGILASTFCKRVSAAALWGYLFGVLVPVGHMIWIANAIATSWRPGLNLRDDWIWFTLTPGACWVLEAMGSFGGGAMPEDPGWAALRAGAVFALLTVIVCTWRISREASFTSRVERRGRRNRPLWVDNPVLARSIWSTILIRPRRGSFLFIAFIAGICFLFLGLGHNENDLDDAWPYLTGMLFASSIITIACLAWSSQSVAHERQTGVLDLVSVSPLTDAQFVFAKAAGVFLRAGQALAIPAVIGLIGAVASDFRPLGYLAWGLTTGIQILFATAFGMALSCRCKTGKSAVLTTFGIFIGGMVVHALIGAVIAIAVGRHIDEGIMFWFGASPAVTVNMTVGVLSDGSISRSDSVILSALVLWNLIYLTVGTVLFLLLPKILSRSRE